MTAIYLHGALSPFGGPYDRAVASPKEAIRCLCTQLKGFRQQLVKGQYRIIKRVRGKEIDLPEAALSSILPEDSELHIVPVVAGAKSGGAAKIILGVVLVAAAFYFAPALMAQGPLLSGEAGFAVGTDLGASAFSVAGFNISFSQIAGYGAAMIFGGISQMLSPTPKAPSPGSGSPDTNGSFIFNGAVNTSEQGVPIPLCYGRFICGSVTPNAAIDTEIISGDVTG